MTTALHEFAPEEIMAHQDGELPADRAQLLAAHLDTCAECRNLAQSFHATSQSLATWTINAAAPSLESGFAPSTSISHAGNSDGIANFWLYLRTRRGLLTLGLAISTIAFIFIEINTTAKFRPTQSYVKKIAVTPIDLSGYVEKPPSAGGGGGGDTSVLPPPKPKARAASKSQGEERQASAVDTPMIARTAELQIIVKKIDNARAAVQSVLERHQGYAASLNVGDAENTARTLSASLRIPSQELPAALAELKSLGHVSNESQAGEEVTAEHADLVARLKNSRETETRLQDILRNRTGKVADVLEVEQEIARVRGEIEQMESEIKTLNHRVDFATINLTITEEYKAKVSDTTPGIATRFHNAAIAGFKNVTDSAVGLTLWFAEYLPPALFWLAILAAPIWWLWRRTRRALTATI
jgi:hypothetical protein